MKSKRRSNHIRRETPGATKALVLSALYLAAILTFNFFASFNLARTYWEKDTKELRPRRRDGNDSSRIDTWIEQATSKQVNALNERNRETLSKVKRYLPLARSIQDKSRPLQLKIFQEAMKKNGEDKFWREVCVYWRSEESTPLDCLVKLHVYLTGKKP